LNECTTADPASTTTSNHRAEHIRLAVIQLAVMRLARDTFATIASVSRGDYNDNGAFNNEGVGNDSVGDFNHDFHFNGCVERERVRPHRSPRVSTGLTEDFLHEFTRAVGNLRLAVEAVIRLHKDTQTHNAPDFREVAAELVGNNRERVQSALLRGLLRVFDGNLRWHRPRCQQSAACHRELPRHNDQVSGPNGWDVGGNGLRCGGECDTEALKRGVWIRH
jgi:hypothetical protein